MKTTTGLTPVSVPVMSVPATATLMQSSSTTTSNTETTSSGPFPSDVNNNNVGQDKKQTVNNYYIGT